jgi:hypothetical protein
MRGEMRRAKNLQPCSSYRLYDLSGSVLRQFRDNVCLVRSLDVSECSSAVLCDSNNSGCFFKIAKQGQKLEFM